MTKNTKPYGIQMCNGLNLSRSVSDPNSRLAKMVNYIRAWGSATRRELAENALGCAGWDTLRSPRGWNGYAYSAAVAAGFLVAYRMGNKVFYKLGPKSYLVTSWMD